MEKFMLGKKIGMTQIFDDNGKVVPVTVIQAGPCTVMQKKTVEDHGYEALQVGYEDVDSKKLNKPERGYFTKCNVNTKKVLKEFRVNNTSQYQLGQELRVEEMFSKGDKVDVSGTSKGKGFQGVMKRHGYSRGPETHGSHYHRGPGSMGGCSFPGRVFKGKKLPGHMGNEKVSVLNLVIVDVDSENKLLLLKGAVPGPKGSLISVRNAVKASK